MADHFGALSDLLKLRELRIDIDDFGFQTASTVRSWFKERSFKLEFLKSSITLLALLAAIACRRDLRVVKSVPEEAKRIVVRATIKKTAKRTSIRENPRLRRKLDGWIVGWLDSFAPLTTDLSNHLST